MQKVIKTVLIVFAVVILVIVLVSVLAIVLFPGEKVKTIAEKKVSETLGTPVSVGTVGLSFAGIPAVKASDILIGEPRAGEPFLFSLKSVKVRVNLLSLLKKRVEIVSVEIDRPTVAIIHYKDGSSNLPGKKPPAQKGKKATGLPPLPIPISLNTLSIKDGKVSVDNRETAGPLISLEKITITLTFDISGDLKRFSSTGKTTISEIAFAISGVGKPLTGISAVFEHELTGDLSTGNLTLSRGNLAVNSIPITVTAVVESWTKAALTGSVEKLDIARLLKAVPQGVIPEQDRLHADGIFSLRIDGSIDTEPEEPVIHYNGTLAVDNTSLSFEGLPKSVDTVSSHITFTEKDIELQDMAIGIGGSHISLSGVVRNYPKEPSVSFRSKGTVDLSDVTGAFPLPEGVTASGNIDFQCALGGVPSDPKTFAAEGGVSINDITVTVPETFNNPAQLNGELSLSPERLSIEAVHFRSGKSDFHFTGTVSNYMTLTGLGEKPAELKGTLRSDILDLNDLLVIMKSPEVKLIKPWEFEESLKTLPIPPRLSGDVTSTTGPIIFGKLTCDAAKARMTYNKGILALTDLHVSAYKGNLIGESTVDFSNPEQVTYGGDFNLKALDSAQFIGDLFGVGDIFRGKLSSSLQFKGAGLDSVSMLQNLKAAGTMNLQDGQIVNWDFTRKLGNYLKFLNFDTIDFDQIVNTFRVENQKFITPDCAMKTKFGDITVNGFTGFDTSLDYDITLNLDKKNSELALKSLSSFSQYMSSTPERLSLNVKAGGSLASPSFTLDTSAAEKLLKDSLKAETVKQVEKLLDSQGVEIKEKGKEILKKLFK